MGTGGGVEGVVKTALGQFQKLGCALFCFLCNFLMDTLNMKDFHVKKINLATFSLLLSCNC